MKFALTILLILFTSTLSAQTYKFGDVPMEHLEMEVYEKDSSASAVVLFEKGETLIDYYQGEFKVNFKYHRRIKILTDDGLDMADVRIGFRTEEPEQDIRDIDAISYTLMDNGKVQKEKVGRRDRFTEKINDSRSEIRFSIPGVQKGSVIEYSYTRTSNNPFDFPDWFFQSTIPVVWSEYVAQIPEWFNYLTFKKGYHDFFVYDQKSYDDRILFGTGSNYTTLDYKGTEYHMVMRDIPGIEGEPYMKASEDYLAHMRFQLASYQLPGTFMKPVMVSWQEVINDLLDSDYFAKRLKSSDATYKATEEATSEVSESFDKMIAVYNYVSDKMEWNGQYGKYSSNELDEILETGTANGSSINLILIQLLRESGIVAHPLIVSTRNNGEVIDMFPMVNQFNHAIAYAEIDGRYFLLDATNENRPYNLLPTSVLNGEGLLIRDGDVTWLPVQNTGRNSVLKAIEIHFDSTGFQGTMEAKNVGYYAHNIRNQLDFTEKKNSIKEIEFDIDEGLEIDSVTITNNILDESFDYVVHFKVEVRDGSDFYYFNPMITEFRENNPFKLDQRTFPVDYNYTFSEVVVMNITLPEGWMVEELPQSVLHRLPERAGEFRRIVQVNENRISFNYKFQISKTRFMPSEYKTLKELYDKMVTMLAESIVLKKAS